MKTVFVNTNRIKPPIGPIGLEYVAEAAHHAGHDVEVLDLAWATDPHDAIDSYFSKRDVGVVAVTLRNSDDCAFTTRESFLSSFAEIVKHIRSSTDAVVFLGGVGFSVMPEKVLALTDAPVGVWGEGEFIFPMLVNRIENGQSYDDLPNLVLNQNGQCIRTPRQFGDLAKLPSMGRGWFDNLRYFNEGGQAGVETKRGCYFKCTYCADPVAKGGVSRVRPPNMVVDEIEALLAMGIDHFHTCDAEFNVPEEHAQVICKEIVSRNLGNKLKWYAYCTPQPFSKETARLMREAGCVGINFGVDHGDDRMLRRLKRSHTKKHIREIARWCKEEGIAVMFDLLIGAPGESLEGIRKTIEFMKTCDPELVGIAYGLRLWPGTELAKTVLTTDKVKGVVGGHDPTTPIFFLEPEIADIGADYLDGLINKDRRFVFFNPKDAKQNYNYNDNQTLVDAIAAGYRGAFWDILRRSGS